MFVGAFLFSSVGDTKPKSASKRRNASRLKAHVVPPGNLWWCPADNSECYRAREECRAFQIRNARRARRNPGDIDRICSLSQRRAACLTYRAVLDDEEAAYCTGTMKTCKEARSVFAASPDHAEVSRCTAIAATKLKGVAPTSEVIDKGTGWWCYDGMHSDCARDEQQCTTRRASMEQVGQGAVLTVCEEKDDAYCGTTGRRGSEIKVSHCSPTMAQCDGQAQIAWRLAPFEGYESISICASFK